MMKLHIYEGAVSEYIAYRQGLPVTPMLVAGYIDLMSLDEEVKDVKTLGQVKFDCKDGPLTSEYDLGTLSRHFDLIEDMMDDNMLQKGEDGLISIPISFTKIEMTLAVAGIAWTPQELYHGIDVLPYYCLRFLRPKDTAYYMRYDWITDENGLVVMDKTLTREETLSFLYEISAGLDNDTRAYLSQYTRVAGHALGPLITHITRTNLSFSTANFIGNLNLLLDKRPSLHLLVLCREAFDREHIVKMISKLELNDNAEGLSEKDWHKIQSRLANCLGAVKDRKTYVKSATILGLGRFFSSDVVCPIFKQNNRFFRDNNTIPILLWMDNDMKNYVARANIWCGREYYDRH
jgi:hypothetical protein